MAEGTFTLSDENSTTAPIPHDATVAQINEACTAAGVDFWVVAASLGTPAPDEEAG